MRFSHFLIFSITILFFSCGKGEVSHLKVNSSGVIVGDELPDWKVLSEESEKGLEYSSLPVGLLNTNGYRCTGFLVGHDHIMTNHHCIPDQKTADTTFFTLQRWATDYSGKKYLDRETFRCNLLTINNKELDFALVRCQNSPGKQFGFVKLSEEDTQGSKLIEVVHHNCDYFRLPANCTPQKLLSMGEILPKYSQNTFFHTADTLAGSSGAPIFSSQTGEVIGLHNSGYFNEEDRKKGTGFYNGAIKINKIIQYINKNLPHFEWRPSN